MMKQVMFSALCLLAMACGAHDNPDLFPESDAGAGDAGELGQSEQAIYMPFTYGIEGGTDGVSEPDDGMQCTSEDGWEDSRCSVPDSKTIRIKFYASTCNSTWQGAVVDAFLDWQYEIEAQGWDVVEGGTNYQIRCSNDSGNGRLGHFVSGPSWDHHSVSGLGTLSQHKNGKVTMFAADTDVWVGNVFPGSAAARQIARVNLIKHELFHVVGFGHTSRGFGPDLMAASPDGTWYTYKDLGNTRRSMLDCYNETSGTGDDC